MFNRLAGIFAMFNRLAGIFAAVLGSRAAQQAEIVRPELPRVEKFNRKGQKRLGRPTPCPKGVGLPWLTYAQHDHLVRLKGAAWTHSAERLGHDFASLLALAEKPA